MSSLRAFPAALALVCFVATLPQAAAVMNDCTLFPLNPDYLYVSGSDAYAYYTGDSVLDAVLPPAVSSVGSYGSFFCSSTSSAYRVFTSSINAASSLGGSRLLTAECSGTIHWWTGSTYVYVGPLVATEISGSGLTLKCNYEIPAGTLASGRTYLISSRAVLTYEWHTDSTASRSYWFDGRLDLKSTNAYAESGDVYVCSRAAPGAPCT